MPAQRTPANLRHNIGGVGPALKNEIIWQDHNQGDAFSYHDLFQLAVSDGSSKSEMITANRVSHLIAVRSRLGRLYKVLHQSVQGLPGISCAGNLSRIRQG